MQKAGWRRSKTGNDLTHDSFVREREAENLGREDSRSVRVGKSFCRSAHPKGELRVLQNALYFGCEDVGIQIFLIKHDGCASLRIRIRIHALVVAYRLGNRNEDGGLFPKADFGDGVGAAA